MRKISGIVAEGKSGSVSFQPATRYGLAGDEMADWKNYDLGTKLTVGAIVAILVGVVGYQVLKDKTPSQASAPAAQTAATSQKTPAETAPAATDAATPAPAATDAATPAPAATEAATPAPAATDAATPAPAATEAATAAPAATEAATPAPAAT
ncbi:MAG: hypothetical protein WCO04_18495, partial [Pseudomonadota bacterium]